MIDFVLLISSTNPAPRIPVGSANMAIPIIDIMLAQNLPIQVTGYISPYPTVVNVATDHHIVAGILENLSGWTVFSQ